MRPDGRSRLGKTRGISGEALGILHFTAKSELHQGAHPDAGHLNGGDATSVKQQTDGSQWRPSVRVSPSAGKIIRAMDMHFKLPYSSKKTDAQLEMLRDPGLCL